MRFFASSQQARPSGTPPQAVVVARCPNRSAAAPHKTDCGWYDSSFDLCTGLEVVEDDGDLLDQLWEPSRSLLRHQQQFFTGSP